MSVWRWAGWWWLALLAPVAWAQAPVRYTVADFARVPKIDAHVHLHGALPRFMAQAKRDGFRLLTVNVDYADFPPIDEQQRDAVAFARTYPGQVAWVAT